VRWRLRVVVARRGWLAGVIGVVTVQDSGVADDLCKIYRRRPADVWECVSDILAVLPISALPAFHLPDFSHPVFHDAPAADDEDEDDSRAA
jgi:hypothetical protein